MSIKAMVHSAIVQRALGVAEQRAATGGDAAVLGEAANRAENLVHAAESTVYSRAGGLSYSSFGGPVTRLVTQLWESRIAGIEGMVATRPGAEGVHTAAKAARAQVLDRDAMAVNKYGWARDSVSLLRALAEQTKAAAAVATPTT